MPGSVGNISKAIKEFLLDNGISTDSLVAIVCDGTATKWFV